MTWKRSTKCSPLLIWRGSCLSYLKKTNLFLHRHTALTCCVILFHMFCDSVLCRVFGVDLPEPKRAVLLELYVQAVLFCREHKFKSEQTSALLSIFKSIHEANVGKLSQISQQFWVETAFQHGWCKTLKCLSCRNSTQQHWTVFQILQGAASLSLCQGL